MVCKIPLERMAVTDQTIYQSLPSKLNQTEIQMRNLSLIPCLPCQCSHECLINTIRKRKLQWFGHVCRQNDTMAKYMAKYILQGKVEGARKQGRPRKNWTFNILDWMGLTLAEATRIASDRKAWRTVVNDSLVLQRPNPG